MNTQSLEKIKVGAKPLSRSRSDRVILGVCSGFAKKLGITSLTSRVIFSVLTVLTGGALIVAYVVAFLLIPQESLEESQS
jgi:phage shock protein PspC (stress-responsive transcriptional regulator)|tara:strand:+ start:3213 stop:3452 length:240 start_codon:yes stop_codon:yes gene_type:complete